MTYLLARFQRRLWHLACWAVGLRWREACASSGYQAKRKVTSALVWWKAARQPRTSYDFILSLSLSLSPKNVCCALLCPAQQDHLAGPCEDNRRVCVRIYRSFAGYDSPAHLHLNTWCQINEWRSQVCGAVKINPAITRVDCCRLVFVSKMNWQIITNNLQWTSGVFVAGLRQQQLIKVQSKATKMFIINYI